MKKIGLLLGCCMLVIGSFAQTLPKFTSAADGETWYYIRFRKGGAVIQDEGEGKPILTGTAARTDAQLWKLTGRQNNARITNKSGRHLNYNGERFITSASKFQALRLMQNASAKENQAWILQPVGNTTQGFIQWGGAGAGREVGLWDVNDANNQLEFILPEDIEIADPEPEQLKEYATQGALGYRPEHKLTLWYDQPVTAATVGDPWMEYALPIGNGQYGAMVYGGIRQERVQLNEKTFWTGNSTECGAYQNLGYLYIEQTGDLLSQGTLKDYVRWLDLSTATAGVSYKTDDRSVSFRQEYIASYPDRCVAIRLSASRPGCLDRKFYFYNPNGRAATYTTEGEGLYYGRPALVSYRNAFRVVPTGGTMSVDETGVSVKGADEILVVITGATDYDPVSPTYIRNTEALPATVAERLKNAAEKGWNALYAAHTDDFGRYFGRVDFDIPTARNTQTTETLVKRYNDSSLSDSQKAPEARMLELLYFHYGRYLLLSSSRGVALPANLQGIWNHSATPPWESDIHANINVQMNYWPAEITNLSDIHMPFLQYVYNMALVQTQWQAYARRSGQSCGWTCYTQNNIFGYSGWMENYVIANAWYCAHLWQHYRYTLDRAFLKNTAFPVMKSCTDYWMERLVEDKRNGDGTLVCPNEFSPEHGPNEDGVPHAQQLTWDLFNSTLKAIAVLGEEAGVSAEYIAGLQDKFERLDPGLHTETVNGKTFLREWKYTSYNDGNGGERGHRHLSHFMALYPCNQIVPGDAYFQPLVNALADRGDESTGWSLGWKMNLWARALDGNHAHRILKRALKHSTYYGVDQYQGGIYYNLFDACAPFQIDGNFGACAGMAEMLLQSYSDTLRLLPALPDAWSAGHMSGLRAVGDFTVDQFWKYRRLTHANIYSGSGKTCYVRYPGLNRALVTDADGQPVEIQVLSSNCISFETQAGGRYVIYPGGSIPDGIRSVQHTRYSLSRAGGNCIHIEGGSEPRAVRLLTADGKLLKRTTGTRNIRVPQNETGPFVVTIESHDGQHESHKIRF